MYNAIIEVSMQPLSKLVLDYSAYHRDGRNKLTHVFGVPIVVYSLFIPLGWFRFAHSDLPITFATVFFAITLICYFRIDKAVGLGVAPISATLLYLAEQTSTLPFRESFAWFVGSFVVGWAIQFLGHYFEGRKPALFDNILQVFNAPLFLVVELYFLLGFKKDLKALVDADAVAARAS